MAATADAKGSMGRGMAVLVRAAIGGPEARQALETVRETRPAPYLADAVRYALESLQARSAPPSAQDPAAPGQAPAGAGQEE